MRSTVFRHDAARLSVADSRVMDDRIEGARSIHIFGHFASLSNARQVADDRCFRSRDSRHRLLPALLVAGMQNDAMSLLEQELCGNSTKPIGRTSDEYARHVPFLSRSLILVPSQG